MADIVQSLFGISPEMYQQSQQAMADKQALQYAQLTPFQQANYAIGRGANMLGGAIGRGLGGEDPELARITMRQQIARQINPNDPNSIKQGIEALATNDPQGAMMLQREYQRLLESNALIKQRERERASADPFQKLVQSGKYTTPSLAAYERSGLVEDLELVKPEKTEPKTSYGPEADRVSKGKFGVNFSELTQAQAKEVDDLLEERGIKKAREGASKLTMPGQKEFADIPKFRADVQKTIAPQIQSVTAADQALQAINDSITSNNFVSFNAARVQLAKALGDSQLSRRDVEQAGGDPSLFGRLLDSTSTLFTGTPTLETQNLIKNTLGAIKKVSTDKANREIDVQRNIAYNTPGYDRARVDAALSFPEFSAQPTGGKKTNTRTLKSGKVVTVIEE